MCDARASDGRDRTVHDTLRLVATLASEASDGRDRTVHDTSDDGDTTGSGKARWLSAAQTAVAAAIREEDRYGHGFLWVPVGLAIGASIWFAAARELALWPVGLLFLAFAALFVFSAGHPARRFASLLVCALLAGLFAAAWETWRHSTILLDSGVATNIVGTVLTRDVDDQGRWRYTIVLEETRDPHIRRPPERVRILARGQHKPIRIGDRISGLARLQPPSGPVLPGTFDFGFNAYFRDLGAFGFFLGPPQRVAAGEGAAAGTAWASPALWLAQLRETIAVRIRAALPGEAGAFASALAVADRRSMSANTVESLRASGLAHVLAISGLHMALVAGTVFVAMRFGFGLFPGFAQAFAVKKLAAVTALLVATFYLLISGASVSTQRAWLMLAIMLCAVLIDRPALTLRNVALAAICIILVTPSAVTGPGFQMSFAATAALVAAYSWWRRQRADKGRADRNRRLGLAGPCSCLHRRIGGDLLGGWLGDRTLCHLPLPPDRLPRASRQPSGDADRHAGGDAGRACLRHRHASRSRALAAAGDGHRVGRRAACRPYGRGLGRYGGHRSDGEGDISEPDRRAALACACAVLAAISGLASHCYGVVRPIRPAGAGQCRTAHCGRRSVGRLWSARVPSPATGGGRPTLYSGNGKGRCGVRIIGRQGALGPINGISMALMRPGNRSSCAARRNCASEGRCPARRLPSSAT